MGAMLEGARNKLRGAGLVLATVAATAAASEKVSADGSEGVQASDPLESVQYNDPYFERSDAFDAGPSMERAHELAERLGMDTSNMSVVLENHVPTKINGVPVMDELTPAEIEEVESARHLAEIMGGEISETDEDAAEPATKEQGSEEPGMTFQSQPVDLDAY